MVAKGLKGDVEGVGVKRCVPQPNVDADPEPEPEPRPESRPLALVLREVYVPSGDFVSTINLGSPFDLIVPTPVDVEAD
jgi:hypothetical protein